MRQERRRLRGHPRRGHAGYLGVAPAGPGRRNGCDAREDHRARGEAQSGAQRGTRCCDTREETTRAEHEENTEATTKIIMPDVAQHISPASNRSPEGLRYL